MKLAAFVLLAGCIEPVGTPPTIKSTSCGFTADDELVVTCNVRFSDPDGDVERAEFDVLFNSKMVQVDGEDTPDLEGKQTGSRQFVLELGPPADGKVEGTIYLIDAGLNEASQAWTVDVTK